MLVLQWSVSTLNGEHVRGYSSEESVSIWHKHWLLLPESLHLQVIIFDADKLCLVGYTSLDNHLTHRRSWPSWSLSVSAGLLRVHLLYRLPTAFLFSCWSGRKNSQCTVGHKSNQGIKGPFSLLAGISRLWEWLPCGTPFTWLEVGRSISLTMWASNSKYWERGTGKMKLTTASVVNHLVKPEWNILPPFIFWVSIVGYLIPYDVIYWGRPNTT